MSVLEVAVRQQTMERWEMGALGRENLSFREVAVPIPTPGDQVVFLPKERILFTGDLIEERMFSWFPPEDIDIDGARWTGVLRGLQRFDPTLIVPGHGDPGQIGIALALATHIEAVGQSVRAARAAGASPEKVLRTLKPDIIAANPDWEHQGLIDWEVNYFAARPV